MDAVGAEAGLMGGMMNVEEELREWNGACVRLEDFVRAHRVEDRSRQVEVVAQLLAEARATWDPAGRGSAMEGTMAVADARVERWFASLMDGGDAARGRAVYYSTGIYRRWPSAFLRDEVPGEMRAAMRNALVQAGPDLEFSSLIRKEVDYGPMEGIAQEAWGTFSWGHVARAFLLWATIFCVVYGFYLAFLA